MHPQIQLPKPGKCPICFMDLIPLESHEDETVGPRELSVGARAGALMELQTAPVERRFIEAEVRMVGKVTYDETRLASIASWVPGRLERLFVDYTGIAVQKGDHLVELYSPELLTAQEELLQALAGVERLAASDIPAARRAAGATAAAAREKLRLWGLTEAQIDAISDRGVARDRVTMYAPTGGIVVHMSAREGMYVQTGTRIYTIADLSTVWVELDAYESDLPWVRYGHEVEFAAEAHPGEVFRGTVSFIQPVLDEASRTVKVRVNVANPDLRLKPGMFVRARVRARVAQDGRVMSRELAGKWISPMHPEVVKDGPGPCDVCGMPLVRAEELGYVPDEPAHAPLVIPDTAPLLTGRRAVVYVAVPGRDQPTYEGREVLLGPRAGGFYVVREGLSEGEQVVTRGAFKLDAELQIRAKPSMMSPHGGVPLGSHAGHQPAARVATARSEVLDPVFGEQLADLVSAYLDIQRALAGDDGAAAIGLSDPAAEALNRVDMSLVQGDDHAAWMSHAQALRSLLGQLSGAGDVAAARQHFAGLSAEMLALLQPFGAPGEPLYQAHCPMAFGGDGAAWLQDGEEISNPYFGAAMLRCGEIQEVFE